MNDNEIYEVLHSIDKRLTSIEVDLRHHIKRSDKHEKWLMTMIVGASMTAGIGAKFLLPYVLKLIG